jgi:hypothetical protein
MNCKCGREFTADDIEQMAEGSLTECPRCSTPYEVITTHGSDAVLPNSIDFDVSSLFKDDVDILGEVREVTKQLFNKYGYDPDDFIVDIRWRVKDLETEGKYITEKIEGVSMSHVRFEK